MDEVRTRKNLVRPDDVFDSLRAIMRHDRSPAYAYGEANPRGDVPARGARWNTPREIADLLLRSRKGLVRLTERELRVVCWALENLADLGLPSGFETEFGAGDEDELRRIAHDLRLSQMEGVEEVEVDGPAED